ncbi:MAG: hypothetical protein AAFV69_00010 [Pseudomonadota bacterium]
MTESNGIKTFVVAASLMASTSIANASSAHEQAILNTGNSLKQAFLADNGDLKKFALALEAEIGELFGVSSKCTPTRSGNLSTAYDNVVESVATGDPKHIYNMAVAFQSTVNRSKMYGRCWNVILERSQLASFGQNSFNEILARGRLLGW